MPEAFSSCQWPKMKAHSACTWCADKCIKCRIDGVLVSNCTQRQMGPSLSKRRCMMTPEILEMASETVEVRKTPKSSRREQAWWAMAHMLEDLVREQGRIQESTERQEELLEELASNTKVIVDAMDLFLQGERFMRVREMGRPEGPAESEMVVRRHRMMGPEKELEDVPEEELEASCDVENSTVNSNSECFLTYKKRVILKN